MKTFATTLSLLLCSFLSFSLDAQLRLSKCNTPSIQLSEVNNDIVISWTTTKEVNSSYFLVESSEDSIHFTAIARVPAMGTSIFPKTYQQVDLSHSSSRYFRVTLLDMNRTRFCSAVVRAPLSDSAITSK